MCADMSVDETISGMIQEQSMRIDDIVKQLDTRWIESEKVLNMIRKNYQIQPPLEKETGTTE